MEQLKSFLVSMMSSLPIIVPLFLVFIGMTVYQNFQEWQECEDYFVESVDKPKMKIDPAKALAARVKFVMRLKRKMKQFKEKKNETIQRKEK